MAGVLVVGAGPAGMAAAACLKRRRVPFVLVDRRGVCGGAFRDIYPDTVLASPARYTVLPGLALRTKGEYVRAGDYRAYLDRYAAFHGLRAEGGAVERIERERHGLRVYFAGRAESMQFDAVVAATGMFDAPVWPEIAGLMAGGQLEVLHAKAWAGPERLRGRRVLIVGGATSAVDIAEECARAGLPTTVSARRGVHLSRQRFLGRDLHDYAYRVFDLIPRWATEGYCERRPTLPGTDMGFSEFRRAGLIRVRGGIERFVGGEAVFADGTTETIDVVVCATGYRFETPYLPHGVPRALGGHPVAVAGATRVPGLYLVGYPCAWSLSSEFLYGIAKDARLVARAIAWRLE